MKNHLKPKDGKIKTVSEFFYVSLPEIDIIRMTLKVMIKKEYVLSLLFTSFLFSCTKQESSQRIGTDEYKMEVIGEKNFYLDSMTSQETNYIQQVNDTTLAFYNKPANTICLFDITSTKQQSTIYLYKEGPNAINDIQGFYFQSDDSIWVYKYWQDELVLLNKAGIIQTKIPIMKNLLSHPDPCSVSPLPGTDNPITKIGNKIILQGMNGPETDRGLLAASSIIYDLVSKQSLPANPYPAIYGDSKEINKNWNAIAYRLIRYTLSPNKEMVLSYPADDSIRIYDIEKRNTISFFAGTAQENDIKPYTPTSPADGLKSYLEHSQYAGIWYDKYRHMYYRLVSLPTTNYKINDETTYIKPLGVIILNEKFQKIGEYLIGNKDYKYRNCFISPEGFHINILSEDDDYLKFITLKPIKK